MADRSGGVAAIDAAAGSTEARGVRYTGGLAGAGTTTTTTRYRMRARNVGGTDWVLWTVVATPDYTGLSAPSSISGTADIEWQWST